MRNLPRKLSLLSLALAAVLLAAGSALAPALADDETKPVSTISGTVVSSTSTELVIETETGSRMTFAVDAGTTWVSRPLAGDKVSVKYHVLSDGSYHAADVSHLASSPPSSSSRYSESLPQTATPLHLIGLGGFVSLVSAGAIWARSRRRT